MNEKEKNDKQNSISLCIGYCIVCSKLHDGTYIILITTKVQLFA